MPEMPWIPSGQALPDSVEKGGGITCGGVSGWDKGGVAGCGVRARALPAATHIATEKKYLNAPTSLGQGD